ncbi:MAG: serine hydrolase, partial [Thermoanaerobaculia bacterium]|nr:serine hydrolase [Thermoanaerobaculia bacterium]
MQSVHGLHHVTAISGPAQENLDFYTGVLGMRRAAARCAAVLLLCAPAGLPAQTESAASGPAPTVSRQGFDEARRVAQTIAVGLHEQASLPGFALAVGLDGEIVFSQTFGFSDLEARSPVVPSTRFRIGSVGKSLTSVGAMRLSESGVLDLDQPIRRYLPDLPPEIGRLSARQLAGHLGGIRHYRDGRLVSHTHYDDVTDALELFIDDPLIAAPGTSYEYSTYSY